MKLIEMKLENFRQFYGLQPKIQFCSGEENITIVFGENGDGKTGIFRALMFALFGITHLDQDNENDKIHLVNMLRLDEQTGMPVEASVEVKFSHNDFDYVINRKIVGIKNSGTIDERISGVSLEIYDKHGNVSPEVIGEEDVVKSIVSEIIDFKIKDFFLFDGEKIETMARTNKLVKQEIKTAIIKLLSFDKLDTAVNILADIYKKESKKVTEQSRNLFLQKAKQEKDDIELQIENTNEVMEDTQKNLEACLVEIDETESKLKEVKPVRIIQEKISEQERQKNQKMETVFALKKSIRSAHLNNIHQLLIKDTYKMTRLYLKQILTNQKDLVSIEVIDKILSEMRCICGTSLNDDEKRNNIIKLKEAFTRSSMTPFIGLINSVIYDFENEEKDMLISIYEYLSKLRELIEEVECIDDEIYKLREEIKGQYKNIENLESLESKMGDKKENANELKLEILNYKKILKDLDGRLKEAERNYEKVMQEDNNLKYDQKKLNYYSRLKDEFISLFDTYSSEMRDELMKQTTEIFKVLIDKKDRDLIDKIVINEKYELELHNWNGTRITQDISQGQRQIVALSFITALAKVAAGSLEEIDFPLFMDTPFGRMSGQNRDNLIQHIPRLASQWVLLLTDTEFSVSEELAVKATKKLGRWYRLDQIKVGHTNIVEVDLRETMATRR